MYKTLGTVAPSEGWPRGSIHIMGLGLSNDPQALNQIVVDPSDYFTATIYGNRVQVKSLGILAMLATNLKQDGKIGEATLGGAIIYAYAYGWIGNLQHNHWIQYAIRYSSLARLGYMDWMGEPITSTGGGQQKKEPSGGTQAQESILPNLFNIPLKVNWWLIGGIAAIGVISMTALIASSRGRRSSAQRFSVA